VKWVRRLWGCYTSCAALVLTLQLLAVFLAMAIALGIGVVRVPILSDVIIGPAPPRIEEAPARTATPTALELRLVQAALPGKNVQMIVPQAEINAVLDDLNTKHSGPMRQMRVDFVPGQVVVKGQLPGLFGLPLQVWGKVETRRGQMIFTPVRAYSGDVPIPSLLVEPFASWANGEIRQALNDRKIPLAIDKVDLQDGVAVIYGSLPDGWKP
jgi:hypothetical protein